MLNLHGDWRTYSQRIRRKPIHDTKMEARFPLGDEPDALTASVGVRDEPGDNCRPTHLRLLFALPSVRVREHKFHIAFEPNPHGASVGIGLRDI